jgi:hypothetical protein
LRFDPVVNLLDVCRRVPSPATPNKFEGVNMKRNLMLMLFGAAIVGAALHYAIKASATPASGFTAVTLAKGTLGQFEVFNHFVLPKLRGEDRKIWLSLQKTKGDSDLYIQSNTWDAAQPGQTVPNTGWHSHPGHSLIIVTAGTLTDYEADDPSCTPHVYTAGMAFVDEGGSHAHIIRNEGTVAATNIAVQLIPAGQARRIDLVNPPGNCPF